MTRYENDCVDCGLTCKGSDCPNRHAPHYYCDKCGYEDELYDFDGQELCKDCLLEKISVTDDSGCCDECGEDDIDVYEYEDRHLCEDCLFDEVPTVE